MGDQPQRGDEVSGCDLQTHVLLTETLQAVQPHPDDPCSGLTREMAEDSRDWPKVEICPTTTDPGLVTRAYYAHEYHHMIYLF